MQTIIRKYWEQLYDNKLGYLEETYHLPRLNQEKQKNLSRPVNNNETMSNLETINKLKSKTRKLHGWTLPIFKELTSREWMLPN